MLASGSVGEKNALSWFTESSGEPVTQSMVQGDGKDLFVTSEGEMRFTAEDYAFQTDPNLDSDSGAPRFSVDMAILLKNLTTAGYKEWEVYRDSNDYLKINVPQGPSAPYARITVSEKNESTREVTLDGATSSSDDGSSLQFRFDYTNNGSYDTNWSSSSTTTTTYSSYDTYYTAKMQVKDAGGRTSTDTVKFKIDDPSGGGGGSTGPGDSSIAF